MGRDEADRVGVLCNCCCGIRCRSTYVTYKDSELDLARSRYDQPRIDRVGKERLWVDMTLYDEWVPRAAALNPGDIVTFKNVHHVVEKRGTA